MDIFVVDAATKFRFNSTDARRWSLVYDPLTNSWSTPEGKVTYDKPVEDPDRVCFATDGAVSGVVYQLHHVRLYTKTIHEDEDSLVHVELVVTLKAIKGTDPTVAGKAVVTLQANFYADEDDLAAETALMKLRAFAIHIPVAAESTEG